MAKKCEIYTLRQREKNIRENHPSISRHADLFREFQKGKFRRGGAVAGYKAADEFAQLKYTKPGFFGSSMFERDSNRHYELHAIRKHKILYH